MGNPRKMWGFGGVWGGLGGFGGFGGFGGVWGGGGGEGFGGGPSLKKETVQGHLLLKWATEKGYRYSGRAIPLKDNPRAPLTASRDRGDLGWYCAG